jgi:hypothetical protein
MALTDPQDTLAYHNSRVLTSHRDMGETPCKNVAKALVAYQINDQKKETAPESEALWFYGLNHGVALIAANRAPLEPLTKWEQSFVELYHAKLADKAVRAFYYLVLICTREARHNKSLSADAAKIGEQFGKPVQNFLSSIKGGEAGIAKAFKETPPDATIGAYVNALRWAFYNSSWSSGYGGAKWGTVTDCLCRFVHGEFSAEMMLDTIWTLQHNGGPIFNKQEFYAVYSKPHLQRLLDIQRSGQIPQAVLTDSNVKVYAEPELQSLMLQLKKQFPDKIGDYVDWEVVEALGSVQKYPQEKAAQFAKWGMSPEAKKAQEMAAAKAKAAAEAAEKQKAEHTKNWFKVMPNLEVKKVQVRAA